MSWRDDVIAGFPSPDDREPRSLRDDIADELADHLACAMHRELKRTDDETTARERVLQRFGSVKSIARRLWWDAMRDRIMKDRIFSVVLIVLTLGFIAAFVLPWVAQQRQIDAAILAKLEQIATRPPIPASQAAVPENWSKLTVRVVRGEGDGPAVADVKVTLTGQPFSSDVGLVPDESNREFMRQNSRSLAEKTDREGRVAYGPILPGVYSLHVSAADLQLELRESITLYPSQQPERVIHYPDLSGPATLAFKLDPAVELGRLDAAVTLRLAAQALKLPSGTWTTGYRSVLLLPDGQIASESWNTNSLPMRVPPRGAVPIETWSVWNPLKPKASLTVAPVSWVLQETRAAVSAPTESPEQSAWQRTRATDFQTPYRETQIEAVAGKITTATITVPPDVVQALHEVQRTMNGQEIPARLIADAEWMQLREVWEQKAQQAVRIARQEGKGTAAVQAYEAVREAKTKLDEREKAWAPQPPNRLPGIRRGMPPGEERSERDEKIVSLSEQLISATSEIQRLYVTAGADDPRLKEAIAKMKDLQRQLDSLNTQPSGPAPPSPGTPASTRPSGR